MPDAPVPLSFPAVLGNPNLVQRLRDLSVNDHIAPVGANAAAGVPRKPKRGDNIGKRWTRRKDNAGLIGNPHTVAPTRQDWVLTRPEHKPTFPEPLPAYLPRTVKVPSVESPPPLDPATANAGRFSIGLRGMRRELRKSGYRTQVLVREVEDEIASWLEEGGVVLRPDLAEEIDPTSGPLIGELQAIRQVARTPLKLVWKVENPTDAFARYVIHCCARYYQVVSYSKDVDGHRLTYLLRPNVTRPDFTARAAASLETPPTTDLDQSSYSVLDSSDFPSDVTSNASESEDDGQPVRDGIRPTDLTDIDETASLSSLEDRTRHREAGSDEWQLVQGDSDIEGGDEGGLYSDAELAHSVGSLHDHPSNSQSGIAIGSLGIEQDSQDPDATILAHNSTPSPIAPRFSRGELSQFTGRRSTSSPSRSPARNTPRRRAKFRRTFSQAKQRPNRQLEPGSSFYDYLFN